MKTLVIIGVDTKGTRVTKTVTVTSVREVTDNPSKFNLSKVNAVMTENSFNQVMGIK